jgi:hypothetical protein
MGDRTMRLTGLDSSAFPGVAESEYEWLMFIRLAGQGIALPRQNP